MITTRQIRDIQTKVTMWVDEDCTIQVRYDKEYINTFKGNKRQRSKKAKNFLLNVLFKAVKEQK
jgi:hypothetical protein